MKTRRGKIYRGSFGKLRPRHPDKKQTGGKSAASGAAKK
jgi:ribosomal small subunit protein bTHX